MRPIIRPLLFVLVVCGTVASQAQVAVGFRGGVNWAKLTAKEGIIQETQARLGPAGAIIIEMPFSERLSLVPEIGFVRRGYKADFHGAQLGNRLGFDSQGNSVFGYGYYNGNAPFIREQNMVLDFIDLGLLTKLHLGSIPAQPHLLAGLTAGWMIGARQYYVADQGVKFDEQALDPQALKMNRLNLALCGGAGFTFTVGAVSYTHLTLPTSDLV